MPRRWFDHKDVKVMLECLQVLSIWDTRGGVFENVVGLNHTHDADAETPLAYVQKSLASKGFESEAVVADLGVHHSATRRRI